MPPDAIISQPFNNVTLDSNFVAALALHSARRDQALYQPGHVSTRTRGLLWFYNTQRTQELTEIAQRSFLVGIIEGGKERMAEIMAQAPAADTATKKQLLLEARTIEAAIKNAARALDGKNS